ncbi:MAG TPA: nucleoside-diphosphate sugar epimerase, partial [Ruminococcaceae bacterium]|nr:nucleoside-diphosphate sugar epimerase [Oscillospiraceae bacterium]
MTQKKENPILVIGGTGTQGGNVARELLAQGHRVRVLSRNPQSAAAKKIEEKGAEIVQGDMSDVASLEPALKLSLIH